MAVVLTVAFTAVVDHRYGASRTAAFGLLGGLAAGLGSWLLVPAPGTRAAGPGSTLRADRTATLAGGVLAGTAAGAVTALATSKGWGLMVSLIAAVTVAWGTSWTDFSIARARLAMFRQTPWQLMTFLDDTRHIGVLRQVGPVYQFRHTRLREQLSQRASRPAPANDSTQRQLAGPHEQVGVRSSLNPARPAALRALTHVALAAAVIGAAALSRAYLPQPGHPADPTLQAITADPPTVDESVWQECGFVDGAYRLREENSNSYVYEVCPEFYPPPDHPSAVAFGFG